MPDDSGLHREPWRPCSRTPRWPRPWGGTAAHATDSDSFSAVVRCHAPNGEVYTVTLGRETVSVSSYSADAIPVTVETWADAVPALA